VVLVICDYYVRISGNVSFDLIDVLGKISGISPFVVDSSGDKSKNRVTMEIEDRE